MKSKISCARGFTLIEVMTVMIVMGAILGLGISRFGNVIEQGKCRNAQTNLMAIRAAIKMIVIRQGNNALGSSSPSSTADVNNALNLTINDPEFDYAFTFNSISGNFTATATRKNGPAYTCTITQNALSTANPTCSDAIYFQPIIQ